MALHEKFKIMVVAGARPNFIKIAPLIRELGSRPQIETTLVHTGQHYDQGMSSDFFTDLGIPEPEFNLEAGSATHAQQTARIISAFEPVLLEAKPRIVVVVGDVNSTLACSLVAVKLGVKVAHVEAGLRSFDREMPEEINRIVTDAIADCLFTTEPEGGKNLAAEGIPAKKVFWVGNIMIDTLCANLAKADQVQVREKLGIGHQGSRFALMTLHRPSNVDNPETLARIIEAVLEVASRVPIVFPVHPRTRKMLDKYGLSRSMTSENGIWLCHPLSYLENLHLLKRSLMVLTDSGGIQEESTYLGIPCLTIRENTERPVTITQGTNTLVGSNRERIIKYARKIIAGEGKKGQIPEKWDGHTAKRIVDILVESLQE